MKWEIKAVNKKLLQPWHISGAEVVDKDFYMVNLHKGNFIGRGEVSYSSKENVDFEDLKISLAEVESMVEDRAIASFSEFANALESIEFLPNGLRFAVEAAFIDYLHQATEIEPWKIIGTNTIKSLSSFSSLPIFKSTKEGQDLLDSHVHAFSYKLKISKETLVSQLEFINSIDKPIILDANESWGSDVDGFIKALENLDDKKVLFIEQPLSKHQIDGYKKLKEYTCIPIFLDESVQDHTHMDSFSDLCHGVVLKASKAGSHMKLVTQMTSARKAGLKTMLGCMLETDVGIASLFTIADNFDYYDLDGFTKLEPDNDARVFWENGKVSLSNMN